MEWIETKKSLPPFNKSVLVVIKFNEHKYIDLGIRIPDRSQPTFHCTHQVWVGTENLTHWMMPPELPVDEKKV